MVTFNDDDDLNLDNDHGYAVNSQFTTGIIPTGSKTVNDPIWGYNIHLEPELVAVVDTPYFQRLRDLKQLGTTYYAFPGASHNRFEHSLGTCHLAGIMMMNIKTRQPELEVSDKEIIIVKMAGLCHDLGHGPFSHVFDNVFLPAVCETLGNTETEGKDKEHWNKIKGWKHEDGSEMMLDACIKDADLQSSMIWGDHALTNADVKLIKELINPDRYEVKSSTRTFLYEIVSNSRCSIDVDKFDYLYRDSTNVGTKVSFDARRLLRNFRVIDNKICYDSKECYNIYTLFQNRFFMFKQVYSHRVPKQIEYMVCDALVIAEPVYNFTKSLFNPDDYNRLTDGILREIENSKDERLQKARDIIYRIRKRNLYKFVGETTITNRLSDKLEDVEPEHICSFKPEGSNLQPEDIIVQNMSIDYGKKDHNPVDHVLFYKNSDPNVSFPVDAEQVSMVLPNRYRDKYLRVFLRKDCPQLFEDARQAYTLFLNDAGQPLAQTSTRDYSFSQVFVGDNLEDTHSQITQSSKRTFSQHQISNSNIPTTPIIESGRMISRINHSVVDDDDDIVEIDDRQYTASQEHNNPAKKQKTLKDYLKK